MTHYEMLKSAGEKIILIVSDLVLKFSLFALIFTLRLKAFKKQVTL